MAEIKFTPSAMEDLREIKAYITDDLNNEIAAKNTVSMILKNVRQLEAFPQSGAPLSSIIDIEVPYRFLICGNYTAFCKIENDEVHIIRILYGRRNFMKILFGEPEEDKNN